MMGQQTMMLFTIHLITLQEEDILELLLQITSSPNVFASSSLVKEVPLVVYLHGEVIRFLSLFNLIANTPVVIRSCFHLLRS